MSMELSELSALLLQQGYKEAANFLDEVGRRLLDREAIPRTVGSIELARRLLNSRAEMRSAIGHYRYGDPENLDQKVTERDELRAQEIRRRLEDGADPYGE